MSDSSNDDLDAARPLLGEQLSTPLRSMSSSDLSSSLSIRKNSREIRVDGIDSIQLAAFLKELENKQYSRTVLKMLIRLYDIDKRLKKHQSYYITLKETSDTIGKASGVVLIICLTIILLVMNWIDVPAVKWGGILTQLVLYIFFYSGILFYIYQPIPKQTFRLDQSEVPIFRNEFKWYFWSTLCCLFCIIAGVFILLIEYNYDSLAGKDNKNSLKKNITQTVLMITVVLSNIIHYFINTHIGKREISARNRILINFDRFHDYLQIFTVGKDEGSYIHGVLRRCYKSENESRRINSYNCCNSCIECLRVVC